MTGPDDLLDERVRAAAFAYLERMTAARGGLVTRADLESFRFEGRRVPLVSPQRGIWAPAGMEAALSILTVYRARPDERPYEDDDGPDGYPRYKWMGSEPLAADNRKLRRAMDLGKPLMWFVGVAVGVYEPKAPVWLVGEEPERRQFVVALDETMRRQWSPLLATRAPFDPARRYAEALVRTRLHQRVFRGRVLVAYERQCALCRLRHPELLDAAHIREDANGGQPIVPNGLAMCAIHHRAFDANVLGVRPDYRVQVRRDVLEEHDGPTLRHTLQGLHGETILVPRRRAERPSRDLLEERYERFRAAG